MTLQDVKDAFKSVKALKLNKHKHFRVDDATIKAYKHFKYKRIILSARQLQHVYEKLTSYKQLVCDCGKLKTWYDKRRRLCLCKSCTAKRGAKANVEASKHKTKKQLAAIAAKRSKSLLKRFSSEEFCKKKKTIKAKRYKTCIERFGYASNFQNPKLRAKYRKKSAETCLKKYGTEQYYASKDFKKKRQKTCLKRYNARYWIQSASADKESLYAKVNETKRKNKTYNTSKPEEKAYKLLRKRKIKVIRQYSDERYPYACDFYLPDYDMFIECHFSWLHYNRPFKRTKHCLAHLEELKKRCKISKLNQQFILGLI